MSATDSEMARQAGEPAPDAVSLAVGTALSLHAAEPGCLLEVLHAVQAGLGYLPSQAVDEIAAGLNLSRADVHGVVTYYDDFVEAPPAPHQVRVCLAEACQAVGGRALVAELESGLGVEVGGRTAEVGLLGVYCFGNCALGPSAEVDGTLVGRATADGLLAALARTDAHDG